MTGPTRGAGNGVCSEDRRRWPVTSHPQGVDRMTAMPSPLEAARELAPKIRAAADEIEAERELPRALFEALADAGLFRLALPRSIGGTELDLPTYVQVIEELGKADASTGWILNQGAIFATYAARMPLETARKIWVDPP